MSNSNANKNNQKRPRPKPVIAIDRIRAVARPDQILRHNQDDLLTGLHVSSSDDPLLFDLDEQDPMLQDCFLVQQQQQQHAPPQDKDSAAVTRAVHAIAAGDSEIITTNGRSDGESRAVINTAVAAPDNTRENETFASKLQDALPVNDDAHTVRNSAVPVNDASSLGSEMDTFDEDTTNNPASRSSKPTGPVAVSRPKLPESNLAGKEIDARPTEAPSVGSDMSISERPFQPDSPVSEQKTIPKVVPATTAAISEQSDTPSTQFSISADDDDGPASHDFENQYMEKLDRDIAVAEEREIMEHLDREITVAEEQEAWQEEIGCNESLEATSESSSRSGVKARRGSFEQVQDFDDALIAAEEETLIARLDREIRIAEEKAEEQTRGQTHAGTLTLAASAVRIEKDRQQGSATADSSSGSHAPHDDGLELVTLTKILPKYFENGGTDPLYSDDPMYTEESFRDTLLTPFLALEQEEGGDSCPTVFSAELRTALDDADSWCLTTTGRSETIGTFQKRLNAWLTKRNRSSLYAFLTVRGILLRVEMDASKSIGAQLTEVVNVTDGDKIDGLLVSTTSGDHQLANAIGAEATAFGAALAYVDGTPCPTVKEFKTRKKGKDGGTIVLGIFLHPDADVSRVPSSFNVSDPRTENYDDISTSEASNVLESDKAENTIAAGVIPNAFGTATKFLPKYLGDSSKLFLTEKIFREALVLPFIARRVQERLITRRVPEKSTTDRPVIDVSSKVSQDPELDVDVMATQLVSDTTRKTIASVPPNAPLENDPTGPQKSHKTSVSKHDFISGNSGKPKRPLSQPVVDAPGTQKKILYRHFLDKYKEAIEMEFKGSGITVKFAIGQMWKQHKTFVGDSCPDDCTCLFDLQSLAGGVVGEKIKQESKNGESKWANAFNLREGDWPLGFIGRFAIKVLPKLKEEYAEEKTFKILQRLVNMWKIHRKNFGKQCKEKCDCSERWELHFKSGLIASSLDKRLRNVKVFEPAKSVSSGKDDQSLPFDSTPLRKKFTGTKTIASLLNQTLKPTLNGPAGAIALKRKKVPINPNTTSNLVKPPYAVPNAAVTMPELNLLNATGTEVLPVKRKVSSRVESDQSRDGPLYVSLGPEHKKQKHSVQPPSSRIDPPSRRDGNQRLVSSTGQSQGGMKEYNVTFDPQQPLGFFCITDKESSGVTCCKIKSIRPRGQASAELRIDKSTTVRAAMVGDARYPIKGYQDLKNYYTRAGAEGVDLRLWFINNQVTETSVQHRSTVANEDWTSAGEWRGKLSIGWAGGTRCVGSSHSSLKAGGRVFRQVSAPPSATSLHEGVALNPDMPSVRLSGQPQKPEQQPFTDDWVKVDIFRPISLHSLPPASCLKGQGPSKAKKEKRVRFAEAFEERDFFRDSLCHEFLAKSSGRDMLPAASSPASIGMEVFVRNGMNTVEEILDEAVRHKTWQDVFRLLLDGVLSESKSEESIEKMRQYANNERDVVKHELTLNPMDEELKSRYQGLHFKALLLKIYKNANFMARMAKSLKNWVRFEITVMELNIHMSSFGRIEADGLNNVLSTTVYASWDDSSQLLPLPSMPLASCVIHQDASLSACVAYDSLVPYAVNHNTSISHDRALTIDLRNELENRPDDFRELGQIRMKLSDLQGKCSKSGNWCDMLVDATPTSFLLNGKLAIRARRVALEHSYVKGKRDRERQRMKEVIKMVTRFNEEAGAALKPADRERYALPPTVTAYGGMSLVQTAVFLEDERLVSQLLDLGADPFAKNTQGQSAVSLALNMADGAVEKSAADSMYYDRGNLRPHTCAAREDAQIDERRKERRSRVDAISKLFHDCALSPSVESGGLALCRPAILGGNGHSESTGHPIARRRDSTAMRDLPSASPSLLWAKQVEDDVASTQTPEVKLPVACNPYWIFASDPQTIRKELVCRYWKEHGSCNYSSCNLYHIQKPLGHDVLAMAAGEESILRTTDWTGDPTLRTFYETVWTSDGRPWVTAALVKMSIPREVYFAEGSPGEIGEDGTYWFHTKAQANEALKMVLIATTVKRLKAETINGPGAVAHQRGFSEDIRPSHSDSVSRDTRKRPPSAKSPDEHSYKRQAMSSSLRDPTAVPQLPSANWLGRPNVETCMYFNREGSCWKGRKCKFQHVQESLGVPLPIPKGMPIKKQFALVPNAKGEEFTRHLNFKNEPGGWVTAGYRNDDTNEIYYAEGAKSGVRGRQGVWWYRNSQAAQSALQKVMIAANLLGKKQRKRSPSFASSGRACGSTGSR
jgi:hypothetical protein